MKIGLGLYRESLTPDNFRFARQAGATHIVAHLTNYFRGRDPSLSAGCAKEGWGDCSADELWDYEDFAGLVKTVRDNGLEIAAIENFSPRFWSDVLLDGPDRIKQIEGLKRLIRDAGRAGIPCIGYNFSIAGVWGWSRGPFARGEAMSVGLDLAAIDPDLPLPDGVVWNMRYRAGRPDAEPVTVSSDELWQRLGAFLREVVPVAEEAGVVLAAHPDDPPAEALRGTARLVNRPEKYDRLMDIVDSPSNGLELCLGSLQEMPGTDEIYGHVRRFAQRGRIGYIHFRNVRGKVPNYHETFVDDGDIDMAEIVRILRDEGYDGVIIPDHTPEMSCDAPWHAGKAFALGYMRALMQNAAALGPSRTDQSSSIRIEAR
ncbi:mannonate dehydratase [Mesorhizobium sp. VK4C]|uniref:mannonate dehydratase n=1 Tax=Mesorhizobium captivum TaxID=3072319 RepID=UPI002A24648C|nr:mannonate dehydratase [Mesorhizobium sp. VK4C]MDX8498821.1 mannonate dehydratase [Mesorhizobium sp. VK4C]